MTFPSLVYVLCGEFGIPMHGFHMVFLPEYVFSLACACIKGRSAFYGHSCRVMFWQASSVTSFGWENWCGDNLGPCTCAYSSAICL